MFLLEYLAEYILTKKTPTTTIIKHEPEYLWAVINRSSVPGPVGAPLSPLKPGSLREASPRKETRGLRGGSPWVQNISPQWPYTLCHHQGAATPQSTPPTKAVHLHLCPFLIVSFISSHFTCEKTACTCIEERRGVCIWLYPLLVNPRDFPELPFIPKCSVRQRQVYSCEHAKQ